MQYFDLHSHILPNIDDGSSSVDMSIEMIKSAIEQGVSNIVVTPHANSKTAKDSEYLQKIKKSYMQLKKAMEDQHLKANLYPGNELMYFQGSEEYIKERRILTINSSRYVLVEFMPGERYKVIKDAMQQLLNDRYQPIIAHVERIDCIRKNPDLLDELKDMAVLLQMNFSSLNGGVLDSRTRYCKKIVKDGYIDLFGSDAHNNTDRPPAYKEAITWILKHCGEEHATKILVKNPICVLKDQLID